MEIIDIRQDDDLRTVARKAEANFRQLAFSIGSAVKKQSNIDLSAVQVLIGDAVDNLVEEVIPAMVAEQLSEALDITYTSTASDVIVEDGCTITALDAVRWGSVVSIRFSYRLSSALTVPSNGDITDVTLGRLKDGWRPANMTNVILDQTRIMIGDVDSSGYVKARSANSRGASYTIDANAVLYASMTFVTGIQ